MLQGVIYRKPGGISLEPENHTEDATASGPHAPPDAKDVPSNVSCGASSQRWRRGGSQQHELWRSRMAKGEWRLVVTGHSLGAGVAALVALKLRPRHPTLKCWSFAPPGEFPTSAVDGCPPNDSDNDETSACGSHPAREFQGGGNLPVDPEQSQGRGDAAELTGLFLMLRCHVGDRRKGLRCF